MTTESDSLAESDPLAQITLSPRAFVGTLAILAMLVGLVLALVPVQVASADPAKPASVTCGNPIGGVETKSVVDGLTVNDPTKTVVYVQMCERALGTRGTWSALLFFSGLIGSLYLGVVRRPRR